MKSPTEPRSRVRTFAFHRQAVLKALLVGESNPYQSSEADAMRYALYPDPPHASGGRFCHVIMGITERDYLRWYDRIDLCHPRWSLPMAREKARTLVAERGVGDVIVLCGSKVAAAFDLPPAPFTVWGDHRYEPVLVKIPHPSGLNRAWHQPGAVARAREVLRSVGVLPEVNS